MQENKTITIDARHEFTDAEMSQLGIHASRTHREHQRAEEEMKSAAKDWKAKLDRIALERDGVLRKLGDGFEMRPVQATVHFNDPSPGRKTFYRLNPDRGAFVPLSELFIREEAMDATDFQRDLPLDGNPNWTAEDEQDLNDTIAGTQPTPAELNPERFLETGDSAAEVREAREVIEAAAQPIGTPFAVKLAQAAGDKTLAPVMIDFPANYPADKYRALWRKAAKKQGWPEAAIDLIDGIAQETQLDATLDAEGAAGRVLDVLKAHSGSTATSDEQTHAPHSEQPDAQ